MATRGGFFLGSENRAEAGGESCDFGLGLRMHQHQHKDSSPSSLPRKKMMMVMSPNQPGFGGAGGNMYDVVDGFGSGGFSRTLQYPSSSSDSAVADAFTFNFSGGAVSSRVPFTAAQWQELQRQNAIYKYMMASVPVPPELIIPISKTNAVSPSPRSNMGRGSLELGFSSQSDPEPWRCRRTDGKKWRCSRDVAPDQKYCERHTHKGRHRSRKPVEVHANFINNSTNKNSNKSCNVLNLNQREKEDQLCSFPAPPPPVTYEQPRGLEWFIKGETNSLANAIASPNQEWHHMMLQSNSKVAHKRDNEKLSFLQQQQHEDPLSFRSYTDLGHANNSLLLGGGQETRLFIDAWSTAERDEIGNHKCSVSSNGKLPFSSLTLSMSAGDDTTQENEIAEMGIGNLSGADRESLGLLKPNWMSPVSWMNSPPGGPLAEALCLGISSSAKEAAVSSPHGCSSNSTTSTSKSSSADGGGQGLNLIN